MNRRGFLGLLAGVAGIALDQAIPFNRVWSFPSEIVVPPLAGLAFKIHWYTPGEVEELYRKVKIGTTVRIRMPQRFIVRDYLRERDQLTKILKVGDTFDTFTLEQVNVES